MCRCNKIFLNINHHKKLLIVAPPGARSGAVCTFLNDINKISFDVGFNYNQDLFISSHKAHDEEVLAVSQVPIKRNEYYPKILIIPEIENLKLLLYLYYKKNVENRTDGYSAKNEYSVTTFDKLYIDGKHYINNFYTLNKYHYDYILKFSDTFNIEVLTKMFFEIHGRLPKKTTVNGFIESVKLSNINVDCNHPAALVNLIIEKEKKLNLDIGYQRKWSPDEIIELYPIDQWHNKIDEKIHPDNYFSS